MNPLRRLTAAGQSLWLDYIRRSFVLEGELQQLIASDGVTGVTSNPAIFDAAISAGHEYDDPIRRAAERNEFANEAYEKIVINDVQLAAAQLTRVFEATQGRDGFVSLEVSPHLAHDTRGTVAQAREFWARVDRPNVFIKVPATDAGLPALRQLIAEGINVNVTLVFGLARYREVLAAYVAGLEDRLAARRPLRTVTAVTSFFLSRIDLATDAQLDALARRNPALAGRVQRLRGQAAIASARQAWWLYRKWCDEEPFRRLALAGAQRPRLLWASTSTKHPGERDVRYVEALIGPETINTMPRNTLEAFREHGDPTPRLEQGREEADAVAQELAELGIDRDAVARQLEHEGVEKFIQPFDHLHDALHDRLAALRPSPVRVR